jgi:iron complex outermembrane recepter protein
VILANDNFYSSIDYWSFDFSDPFQTESAAQLIGAYTANSCPDVAGAPGAGAGTPACVDLLARFTPTGTPTAGIQRIQRNIINGADQKTTGLDFTARYTFDDIAGGELTVGTEGTYVLEYTSADFLSIAGTKLANGGEFVGKLNRGDPTLPKPEVQAQLFARWGTDAHRMNYQMRYVSSYDDVAPSLPSMAVIDSHITHDVHYINNMIDNVTLSLSIVNLADEDPPLASTDLSFDPYTHNAFGRMIKVGFVYTPDFGL